MKTKKYLEDLKTKSVAGYQFWLRNMEEEKYVERQILGITGGGQTLNLTKKVFFMLLKVI